MKISEMILKLQEIKNENGDLDVKCLKTKSSWCTGELISTFSEEINKKSFEVNSEYLFIGENTECY